MKINRQEQERIEVTSVIQARFQLERGQVLCAKTSSESVFIRKEDDKYVIYLQRDIGGSYETSGAEDREKERCLKVIEHLMDHGARFFYTEGFCLEPIRNGWKDKLVDGLLDIGRKLFRKASPDACSRNAGNT